MRTNSKKNHLKLITIIPDAAQVLKCSSSDKVVLPSVEEWINYFMYADYIVTDSFHATVFSIMFQKAFSSCTFAGYNGRIYNILCKTGLEMRVLYRADIHQLDTQFKAKIDYHTVNEKLTTWQEESRNWLNAALGE